MADMLADAMDGMVIDRMDCSVEMRDRLDCACDLAGTSLAIVFLMDDLGGKFSKIAAEINALVDRHIENLTQDEYAVLINHIMTLTP